MRGQNPVRYVTVWVQEKFQPGGCRKCFNIIFFKCSKPIAVVLDFTKVFNMAKLNIMFERLLNKGMPAVVVQVLAHSYVEQEACVRWGRTSCSGTFGISNGTRQGSVTSLAFWCIYLDFFFC